MATARLQAFWNHPAGPKTIHFWAPTFKWGLVIAGLADLNRPVEKVSTAQQSGVLGAMRSITVLTLAHGVDSFGGNRSHLVSICNADHSNQLQLDERQLLCCHHWSVPISEKEWVSLPLDLGRSDDTPLQADRLRNPILWLLQHQIRDQSSLSTAKSSKMRVRRLYQLMHRCMSPPSVPRVLRPAPYPVRIYARTGGGGGRGLFLPYF
eukprot:768612-Hanusia_phi.AAC.5